MCRFRRITEVPVTPAPPIPPTPTIIMTITEPKIQIAEVGSTVRFHCSGQSLIGRQVLLKWSKEQSTLPVRAQDDRRGVLIITDVRSSDSGSYICSAFDGIDVVTETVVLNVAGKIYSRFIATIVYYIYISFFTEKNIPHTLKNQQLSVISHPLNTQIRSLNFLLFFNFFIVTLLAVILFSLRMINSLLYECGYSIRYTYCEFLTLCMLMCMDFFDLYPLKCIWCFIVPYLKCSFSA